MSNDKRDILLRVEDPRDKVYLPELFESLNSLLRTRRKDDKTKAINVLHAFVKSGVLEYELIRDYLQSVYHPAVVLDLPPEIPPYNNKEIIDFNLAPLELGKALKQINELIRGTPNFIEKSIYRENKFIQMLEKLYDKDSVLLLSVLLKQFPLDLYPKLGISFFANELPLLFNGIDVDKIDADEKLRIKKLVSKRNTTTKESLKKT